MHSLSYAHPQMGRALLVFLPFLLSACAVLSTKSKSVSPPAGSGPTQIGMASWYGPGFHGRRTAAGTVYNQNELTAAHRTLPMGTRVQVTNLENGRATQVTINDRGPFVKGRIIDLSYAAARQLGIIGPGTALVRVEVIGNNLDQIRERLAYTLQLGSFTALANAQKLRDELVHEHPNVSVVRVLINNTTLYRVQLGTFSDRDKAEVQARELALRGFPVIVMEK